MPYFARVRSNKEAPSGVRFLTFGAVTTVPITTVQIVSIGGQSCVPCTPINGTKTAVVAIELPNQRCVSIPNTDLIEE